MEQSVSRVLVEVAVKTALKNIHDSPERGIRNLVDMALQCAEGRFQHNFFATAQTMLQNEDSAYYELVRDTVAHTDPGRLYTFGMNLGYNACTVGARHIRENEKKLGCNIPWAVGLQTEPQRLEEYQQAVQEGEELGIYMWMLFAGRQPEKLLPLAEDHPDSALCLFCGTEDLTDAFLDEASNFRNVMLLVPFAENAEDRCAALRDRRMLYSVWYQYGQRDTERVINGEIFDGAQQLAPAFTVLLPEQSCPKEVHRLAHQAVQSARSQQTYRTILWEMPGDNCLVDSIISDDTCSVYFDKRGDLCSWEGKMGGEEENLFQNALADILVRACPKERAENRADSQ